MKLTEIIGLEEKHAQLLGKAGIKEAEDLLALSYYQIKQLARSIGVTVNRLDTWQEHADLMRIEGVNPEIANALNLIGIDSVKEFAYRNSKKTVLVGLFALAFAAMGATAHAGKPGFEKCQGIAIAGMNDCAALDGKHKCSGQSTVTNADNEWAYVPQGTCAKITGGTVAKVKPAK